MFAKRILYAAEGQVAALQRWRITHQARRIRGQPRIESMAVSDYDPRAQLVSWFSPTLGVTKRLHIYLPPEYATSGSHYPVLYLLRGHEREWLNTEEDASRQGKNVLDVYDRLLAAGDVGPMILVMPSLTSDDGHVHGVGVDFLVPWLARHAGVGSGRWESYFLHDVIPLVDTHWRTLPLVWHRGVDGFSLGGAVAVKLAAKYPDLFRTVGAYDGTFFYAADDPAAVRLDDPVLKNSIFDPAFGHIRNSAHVVANSPANLILQADGALLARATWMIHYGPEAVEPWGSNFYRGEHLIEVLRRRGVANALVKPALADGDHTWRTADRHLEMTLPIHWQALGRGIVMRDT